LGWWGQACCQIPEKGVFEGKRSGNTGIPAGVVTEYTLKWGVKEVLAKKVLSPSVLGKKRSNKQGGGGEGSTNTGGGSEKKRQKKQCVSCLCPKVKM